MTLSEIRRKYLDFFRARGHSIVPSAKIVPENDPTTLFTGSGMQPMLPYFLGEPHPQGKRIADSQKSFRAQDIEEVGDNRHTTFFEMLGNWSFGDYFKDEQIPWMYEFLTKELKLDPARLYFTCYAGNEALAIPRDTHSAALWKSLGVPEDHISFYGDDKNWWSRVGAPQNMPEGEPGGPDTEMFYDFGPSTSSTGSPQASSGQARHTPESGERCHPNCECGRFVEIGNNVFMEYVKRGDMFEKLPKPNVDFGAGLERMAMAVNDVDDIFLIDTMQVVIAEIAAASGIPYKGENKTSFRIVADHIRGATFMIGDGVHPSNTDQGYVLRRLLRRAIRHLDLLGIKSEVTLHSSGVLEGLSERVVGAYRDQYPELDANRITIQNTIRDEEQKFRKTLASGIKEFEKILSITRNNGGQTSVISGKDAFVLFSTYGFPFELTQELAAEHGTTVNRSEFEEEMKKHQTLSRAGAEQKFAGGLADHAEQTIKYHTTHHLLLKALQIVLGPEVHQRGSNITSERLRIDFSFPRKMTGEEKRKVEELVNQKIAEGIPVIRTDMKKEEAEKLGAEHEFGATYPDIVSVYSVGPLQSAFSIEFCGGPHVENTRDIIASIRDPDGFTRKRVFKITKEEAVAQGIRRIKAVLE